MIKLDRQAAPPEIIPTRAMLVIEAEIAAYISATQSSRFKVNFSVLNKFRPLLAILSNDKCAYCESKLGVTSSIEIGHYRPKGGVKGSKDKFLPHHYFWLAYEWENLLPTCPRCDRYKMNYFPLVNEEYRAQILAKGQELEVENPLILNPCIDDPEQHLLFDEDGNVYPHSPKGDATIKILQLDRPALIESRRIAAKNFEMRLLSNQIDASDVKNLFSTGSGYEYAAVLRIVYNRLRGPKPNFQKIPIRGLESLGITEGWVQEDNEIGADISYIDNIKRFSIKSIEIKNFRTIEHIKLHMLSADVNSELEPCMLILGDNGVGKSSILQAIAMTLSGKKVLKRLKLKPSDLLPAKKQKGFIRIESDDSQVISLEFDRGHFYGLDENPTSYTLGYGATRLLPKDGLKYKEPKNAYININNLFNYSYPLNDANTWIKSLPDEKFERVATALFDLLDLETGDKVIREEWGLKILDASGHTDLEKTSDGYKSMIALACDIMKTLSFDGAGYHSVYAIVLIDELGNHLHPRWRMKIMDALRKTFPKVQFIVSTHEPLCLRGMRYGEVNVLLKPDLKHVICIGPDQLPDHTLMRVDQLLTSDLFGLLNTYDAKTEEKLRDYHSLLAVPEKERTVEQTESIVNYSSELSRNDLIGNSPQIQILYQLINEKFAQNALKNDFKPMLQLKKETTDELEKMLDDQELDWL